MAEESKDVKVLYGISGMQSALSVILSLCKEQRASQLALEHLMCEEIAKQTGQSSEDLAERLNNLRNDYLKTLNAWTVKELFPEDSKLEE